MPRRILMAAGLVALFAPVVVGSSHCDNFWIEPATSVQVGPELGEIALTLNAPQGCSYAISRQEEGSFYGWLQHYPDAVTMEGTQFEISVSWESNERGPRTASIVIQGPNDAQLFTVEQAGAGGSGTGCTYSVSNSNFFFNRTGGSASFVLVTDPACSWQLAADSWIAAGPAGTNQGTQTVTFSVEPHDGSEARIGHITAGTASVTIAQSGVTDSGSSPSAPPAPALGGTGSGHDEDDLDFGTPGPSAVWGVAALAAAGWLVRRRS